MDIDLNLAIGATLLFFAVPSLIAAALDRRFPRVAVLVSLAGLVLILWAGTAMHGSVPMTSDSALGFLFDTLPAVAKAIPHAMIEVVGRMIGYFV